MYRNRTLLSLLTAALVSFPVAVAGAQDPKPVTPEQVGKNVERESKRVANRTGDVVDKAATQTEKQAKRTAKGVKKLYSRKARREARGEPVTTTSAGDVYRMTPGTPTSKPLTPGQVGKNTEAESKRVANRTGDVIQKAGKQTEKQAKRTATSAKKLVSRKARREARGDTLR
jgi:hypothetical protein